MLVNVDVECEEDVAFLYELLRERYEAENINIRGRSLNALPEYGDYRQHLRRIVDDKHFIWCESGQRQAYVFTRGEDREVGVFVLRQYRKQGVGDRALSTLLADVDAPVTAMINPQNVPSRKLFQKNGFELVGTLWRKAE